MPLLRPRPRAVRVLLGALLIGALVSPAAAAPSPVGSSVEPPRPTSERAASKVVHRVVWDDHRRGVAGIHLRSARIDGTDERPIYDLRRGFTTDLTPDNEGRRVAFATCCSDRLPQLVVVPVRGGKALEPLARHRHLSAVGGIGWSPNGRRLAFEAVSIRGDERVDGIWTGRPDGRGLRQVITLRTPDETYQPVINKALAWTRHGILYSDGQDLRSARAGRSTLVLRHVISVRVSGDHRHLVVDRCRGDRHTTWVTGPDGRHARRVLTHADLGEGTAYHDITPNHDGSELLAYRSRPSDDRDGVDIVTWPTTGHVRSATVLDFVHGNSPVTWS